MLYFLQRPSRGMR